MRTRNPITHLHAQHVNVTKRYKIKENATFLFLNYK